MELPPAAEPLTSPAGWVGLGLGLAAAAGAAAGTAAWETWRWFDFTQEVHEPGSRGQAAVLTPGEIAGDEGAIRLYPVRVERHERDVERTIVSCVVRNEKVHVLGGPHVAVGDDREAADDDEASAGIEERRGDRGKIRVDERTAHRG